MEFPVENRDLRGYRYWRDVNGNIWLARQATTERTAERPRKDHRLTIDTLLMKAVDIIFAVVIADRLGSMVYRGNLVDIVALRFADNAVDLPIRGLPATPAILALVDITLLDSLGVITLCFANNTVDFAVSSFPTAPVTLALADIALLDHLDVLTLADSAVNLAVCSFPAFPLS